MWSTFSHPSSQSYEHPYEHSQLNPHGNTTGRAFTKSNSMLSKQGSESGCCWGSKSLLLKLLGLFNKEGVWSKTELPLLADTDISTQREKWYLLPSRSFKLSIYLKIPNQLIYVRVPPPRTKGSVWHPPMQCQLSQSSPKAHFLLGIPHLTQSVQSKNQS